MRDARRRRRELDRQRIQFDNAPELKRALYQVERYENYVALLRSVHVECAARRDWDAIARAEAPSRPEPSTTHADEAERRLAAYVPGLLDRLLGRVAPKVARLREEVEAAKRTDAWAHEEALHQYDAELAGWQASRGLALRICAGDAAAFLEAIEREDPFAELRELGANVTVRSGARPLDVTLHLHERRVLPDDVKTLARDDRLCVRPMEPEQLEKLRRDFACSAVLRIARELFALLPADSLSVTAVGESDGPVLAVAVSREALEGLELSGVDPASVVASLPAKI